jgi:hypothetical protein
VCPVDPLCVLLIRLARTTPSCPKIRRSIKCGQNERQRLERIAAGDDWARDRPVFTTTRGTMLDVRDLLRSYYLLRDVAALPKSGSTISRHTAATSLREAALRTDPRVCR